VRGRAIRSSDGIVLDWKYFSDSIIARDGGGGKLARDMTPAKVAETWGVSSFPVRQFAPTGSSCAGGGRGIILGLFAGL
jgi:hypothetical protein